MSSPAEAPLRFEAPGNAEEAARAQVYGLLARLYHAPHDAALHHQLAAATPEAPQPGAFLEAGWAGLVAAARRLTPQEVALEHDALFGGVGKPEIALHGSWYLAGALHERPLVKLRDDLAALGLERPPGVHDSEDHIAALCQVMHWLITGDDEDAGNLASQQRFFDAHLRPWTERLCDAIEQHPAADFYRALAGFTRDFLAVEGQAFDLL